VGWRQQAQTQLLNIMAKVDDLYEVLNLDGINAQQYFERVDIRCRKQFAEQLLPNRPEGSDDDDKNDDEGTAFVDGSKDIREHQHTTTTLTKNSSASANLELPVSHNSEMHPVSSSVVVLNTQSSMTGIVTEKDIVARTIQSVSSCNDEMPQEPIK
jgi:hypothetical protein